MHTKGMHVYLFDLLTIFKLHHGEFMQTLEAAVQEIRKTDFDELNRGSILET